MAKAKKRKSTPKRSLASGGAGYGSPAANIEAEPKRKKKVRSIHVGRLNK